MKPQLNKIRPLRIPLRWENKHGVKLIGYYYPQLDQVYTTRGHFSVLERMASNGKGTVPKNKMHDRRVVAAYHSEDYTYRGE